MQRTVQVKSAHGIVASMMKTISMSPFGALLGARMKAFATLTLGATAFVGAFATGAMAEDAKNSDLRETDRSFVAVSEWTSSDDDGMRLIVDEVTSKDSASLTAPPPPATVPAAPRTSTTSTTSTVRMVVEAPQPDEPDAPGVCVFVPAGDEAGGALSCPGGNVRVFEFGPDHGRQFIIGDEVIDSEDFRALVQARIAEVNARLAENGAWNIEVLDGFDSEEFQHEMEALGREMERLQRTMQFEFQGHTMTAEERGEYEAAMAEFRSEMAELQAEAMAEAAAAMAELRSEGIPVAPAVPSAFFSWHEDDRHRTRDRQVIRVERDGEEHITIIENVADDDGNPRVVIRTTDPDSIEVVHIDADDFDEDED